MPTVADLQIKIGADVNAAINGLSKAEFATNNVSKAMEKAIQSQNSFTNTIATIEKTIKDVANYEINFFDATTITAQANKLKPIIDDLKLKLESNKLENGGFFSEGFKFDITLLNDLKTAFNDIKNINPNFAGLESLNQYIVDFEKNLTSGLDSAITTPDKVLQAFEEANGEILRGGFVVAAWAQNFSTAIESVQRELASVDLGTLDEDQKESLKSMQNLTQGALNLSDTVSKSAAAFSGMQAIAGASITGIATLIPSLGTSLAALAGPIGIVAGGIGALGVAYLTTQQFANQLNSEEKELNKSIVTQTSEAGAMINILKSGNLTYEKKQGLIKEINDQYGTTIKNLSDEKDFVQQLDTAYLSLVESIKSKIIFEAGQKELEGLIKQQIQLENAKKAVVDYQNSIGDLNKALAEKGASASQQINPLTTLGNEESLKDIDDGITKIGDKIKEKSLSLAEIFNKVLSTGSDTAGKKVKSDADQIEKILSDLDGNLKVIEKKFIEGIIPNDKSKFEATVDAMASAIDAGLKIDPNNDKIINLIEGYKNIVSREKINISIIPTLDANISSLAPLPDRVSDLALQMNKSFSKINFAQSFEGKAAAVREAIQKELQGVAGTINTVASQVGNALDTINTFEQASFTTRNNELDAYYEKQRAYIEKTTADEGIKNKRLEELEKEVAAKRLSIKREEAAANKRNAIFNSLINTAQAVSAQLATGNIPLAVLVGALGAAQTAAIAATPLPALAKGGVATGRNTVIVGEYPGADNNPELILPADKAKKYIVEAVTSTGASGGGFAQQLYSYVSGDDLMLISERGAYRKTRLG